MAEYLIRHGADIEKRNKYGETCLMKAVELKEICQLLIDKGADVKAQDENGDLALHHAIEKDRPGTVELLLDHGSDPYVKNKAGDDAFQMASLKVRELILNQLLFKFYLFIKLYCTNNQNGNYRSDQFNSNNTNSINGYSYYRLNDVKVQC